MPGKVKYSHLTESEKKEYLGDFYTMVALLRNRDEVKNFLKDLLTLSETVMISRRIQIAKMLLSGATHKEVRERLKVGYSTITQVDRWLNNGFGGYKSVLDSYQKNKKEFLKNVEGGDELTPYSFDWARKKYPAQFMLINMLMKNKK